MWAKVLADASTLLYLAKTMNGFGEAELCVESLVVPPAVWSEAVDAGDDKDAPEVAEIRLATARDFVQRIELTGEEEEAAARMALNHRLGAGESQVLLVGQRGGRVLIDEVRGTRAAQQIGLQPASTLLLPLLGRLAGRMDEQRSVSFLRRLAVATGASASTVFAIEDEIRRTP